MIHYNSKISKTTCLASPHFDKTPFGFSQIFVMILSFELVYPQDQVWKKGHKLFEDIRG